MQTFQQSSTPQFSIVSKNTSPGISSTQPSAFSSSSDFLHRFAEGVYAGAAPIDTSGIDFGVATQGQSSEDTSAGSDAGVADIDAGSDAEITDVGSGDDEILRQQYEEEILRQEKEQKDLETKAASNRSLLVLGIASLVTASVIVYVARSNK